MMWTDNPVRDAERYQQELENRPCLTCSVCGGSLYDGDTYYEIDNEDFCPECMISEFRKVVDLEE